MRLYARSGQRSAALRQYEDLICLLQAEGGGTPEEETTCLYEHLWAGKLTGQQEPLLKTKLYLPQARRPTVERPGLVARIEEGLRQALTLLSAPAGFGKTTLLVEWAQSSCVPVAWLSLDDGDNDPARFLAYLIHAVGSLWEGLSAASLEMARSPQPLPFQTVLVSLLNELTGLPEPSVLVLDDYHAIQNPVIHNGLGYLLEHLPPNLRLILATRADPSLPLARLRARDQLVELRTGDLRFTPEEVAQFLEQVMGLQLPAAELAILEARTEGWIAGLHMAALAIQGLSRQGREDVRGFLQAFRGSHRYIFDYLTEEALNHQPAEIQHFLLHTSILDRLTAPLCDAILEGGRLKAEGGHDPFSLSLSPSASILDFLDRSNLFLLPLDGERRWFRYHPLFADLLRTRLESAAPELVPVLQRRASEWHEQNEWVEEAARYAYAAHDSARLARLVKQHAGTLIQSGSIFTLVSWVRGLPPDLLKGNAWALILSAWSLMAEIRADEVAPLLDEVEKLLQENPGYPDRGALLGLLASLRAASAEARGDVEGTIACAAQALEILEADNHMPRAMVGYSLGRAFYLKGAFDRAALAWSELIQAGLQSGACQLVAPAAGSLANLRKAEGRLGDAVAICQTAVEAVRKRGPHLFFGAGIPFHTLGDSYREMNRLEAAEELARQGCDLNRQWGNSNAVCFSLVYLARVLLARGDLDQTRRLLEEAEGISRQNRTYPEFDSFLQGLWVRLHLTAGDVPAATRCLQENPLHTLPEPLLLAENSHVTLARLRVAQGEGEEALRLLAGLAEAAERGGRFGRLIEILNLQAVALYQEGERAGALVCLQKSLGLALPQGFARLFIDEGAPLAALLRMGEEQQLWDAPALAEYAARLLEAFEA
jgi:LuxR family maltose regulon positive regulatory protein